MENYFNRFRLNEEKEEPKQVYDTISKSVPFTGTNLWILIFAIFIASLGLNVNSTAVIIGAMLISPLMGPIMGLGYSAATNDSSLLRKSLTNYLFALVVGLLTSFIYFLLTPIHEAQSELLARTQPNIYDVLIATFGGFAGVLAACSKQKGNVIPGVAIATALMPPLCTAGYGLAAMNMYYLFGALYLFLINSVFIALATFLTVRFLRYPFKEFLDEKERKKSTYIIVLVTSLTLIPSIYFGWDIVQKNKFKEIAEDFVKNESKLEGSDLWKYHIEPRNRTIDMTYAGQPISDSTKQYLNRILDSQYHLKGVTLEIHNGLSSLNPKEEEIANKHTIEIEKGELERLEFTIDSLRREDKLNKTIYGSIKALYPSLSSAYIQRANLFTDSSNVNDLYLLYLKFEETLKTAEKDQIIRFLDTTLQGNKFELVIQ